MDERMSELRARIEEALANAHNKEELAVVWQNYLGKKGQVAELMKGLGKLSPEERPAMGKVINEFKGLAQAAYEARAAVLEALELEAKNRAERVDITLPARRRPAGNLHPITITKNEIIDVFAGMGFEIYESPEIEDDDHNFTRLNVPKNHPARDMQDTFYVADDIVLRTQTSAGQIRYMDEVKPPLKVLVPGRVFRSATFRACWMCLSERFSDRKSRPDSARAISPSPNRARRLMYPASSAAARAAAWASIPAGSRSWAAVWCITVCWNPAGSIRKNTPALPSASASSVSPC